VKVGNLIQLKPDSWQWMLTPSFARRSASRPDFGPKMARPILLLVDIVSEHDWLVINPDGMLEITDCYYSLDRLYERIL